VTCHERREHTSRDGHADSGSGIAFTLLPELATQRDATTMFLPAALLVVAAAKAF
jgi:hypothetical protein